MAKVMNGIRGNSNEVKYPVNCASRVKTPAFTGSGSMSEAELDDLYEPKPDKKVVRVVTVIAYMFSVSLGAIVLSLYYLFLWNPYKGVGRGSKSSTIADNSTIISTSDLSEIITSPTVTTLLNSTAVLISSAALLGTAGSRNVNDNFDSVTPKTLKYKQKRSSERVANFEERLKTSFSPFYMPNKLISSKDMFTKKNGVSLVEPILEGNNKGVGQPNILTHTIVEGDRKNIKRKLRTLDLESVKSKSPYEMYNLVNPQPFYLEDPFTTYAKAQRARGRQNSIQGIRHHFFHAKEQPNEKPVNDNHSVPNSLDVNSSSSIKSVQGFVEE